MQFARPALAAIATLLFSAPAASAWGDVGHEAVCEIAFQELTPRARQAVEDLMAGDQEHDDFYLACTWPDTPKKLRSREHFVNLLRDAPGIGADPCPIGDKCVVTAIIDDFGQLANGGAAAERLASLKFLGHWLGDIHQPLHVSFVDDRGGNSIEENGPCVGSLHAVWDDCIVEERLGTDPLTIAEALRAEVTEADRAAWIPETMTLDVARGWANESFAIATDPATEYCVLREGVCWYSETTMVLGPDDSEKTVRADRDYLDRHAGMVARRLKMAGVRLGWLLNKSLEAGE